VYTEIHTTVPDFLVILLRHREYRGVKMGQERRYVQLQLQQTASFIVIESLDVPPEHTHIYILPSALIIPDNVFLPFFHHALSKFKVRPVSPYFRVEAEWLK